MFSILLIQLQVPSRNKKTHPSILKLDESLSIVTFNFKPISEEDMTYMIQGVDTSKAIQKDDIPPKILKANVDICSIV